MKGEKASKPLTLEDYAAFFRDSHFRRRVSHDQLNQVIFMHGFVKLHRWQKALIVDTLNSLDLMRPERSTVQGRAAEAAEPPPATSAAALSLEEAKKDIAALGWQECPLGSVFTVSGATDVQSAVPVAIRNQPSSAARGGGAAQRETGGKKKRKRTLAELASRPLPPRPK